MADVYGLHAPHITPPPKKKAYKYVQISSHKLMMQKKFTEEVRFSLFNIVIKVVPLIGFIGCLAYSN